VQPATAYAAHGALVAVAVAVVAVAVTTVVVAATVVVVVVVVVTAAFVIVVVVVAIAVADPAAAAAAAVVWLPPTPRSALDRAVRRALADEAALELLRSGRKAAAALVEHHAQLVAALAPAAAVTADMATSLRELELSRERALAQRGLIWGAPPVEEARLL
jgi:hypothetical protein